MIAYRGENGVNNMYLRAMQTRLDKEIEANKLLREAAHEFLMAARAYDALLQATEGDAQDMHNADDKLTKALGLTSEKRDGESK